MSELRIILCAYMKVVTRLFVAIAFASVLVACEASNLDQPTDTSVPILSPQSPSDTSFSFKDPSAPVSGGTGLPDSGTESGEEVDCDNAEDLCDSGEWACDDIADYCDYGPDDGSELPDDWDWDQ
jgi:hypothetical protein